MKDIRKLKSLNVMIAIGIALFIGVALLAVFSIEKKAIDVISLILTCAQFILGILIMILSIKITHRATQLFIGITLVGWGLAYFLTSFVWPIRLVNFWPSCGLMAGLFLFIFGCYKYATIKFGYFIPSIVLIGMGTWYSFFSFDLIKTPFLEVVKKLGPVFLALIAVLLIALFFIQKRDKKFIVTDDETGTFSDEESEIGKHLD